MEYEFKFDDPITATGYDGKQHKVSAIRSWPWLFSTLNVSYY